MITAWDIYLLTRLDSLLSFAQGLCVLTIIGLIVCLVGSLVSCLCADEMAEGIPKKWRKAFWIVLPITIFINFVEITIPSTKTVVAMWGIPKIVNNEELQQIPSNATKFINSQLKEWIEEYVDTGKEVVKEVIKDEVKQLKEKSK